MCKFVSVLWKTVLLFLFLSTCDTEGKYWSANKGCWGNSSSNWKKKKKKNIPTCSMYHKDHDTQLATVNIVPLIQLLGAMLPPKWNGAPCKLCIICPLYKIIIKAPVKDNIVPKILACPRRFLTSTASNLFKRIMKKIVKKNIYIYNSCFTVEHFYDLRKIQPIFNYSPESNCKYKCKRWDGVDHWCDKGRSGILQTCKKHVQRKTDSVFHSKRKQT